MNITDALASGKITLSAKPKLFGTDKIIGDFLLIWGDASDLRGNVSDLRGDLDTELKDARERATTREAGR